MKINDCGWFRKLILVSIYMLGIAGIVASGGGSDGEEGDEIVIQSLYEFLIGGPLIDDPGNSTIGITKQGEFTVITEPNLVGTVVCNQVTEVCELQTINPPSSIIMSGDYEIKITIEEMWNYNPLPSDRPRFGRSLIERVGKPDIFAEVMDCGGGSPGVDVQGMTDGSDGCYPWDTFEALADNPGINDAALASLAWEAVAFIVEQGSNVLEVFPLIVGDVFAALGNPISEPCEIYSGTWAGGPVNPGNFTLGWIDDVGNGRVGPGDSFSQTFNDCWFGDTTDGALLNGSIDYVGYTQDIDQNGLLTRIGFETAAQGSGKIGGVAFNSLVLTETTENNNIITTEPPITLTGRYLIVFF